MSLWTALAIAVAIVAGTLPLRRGRAADRRVDAVARRVNLSLDPRSEARVRARLLRRDRWATTGGLVALVALGVAAAVVPALRSEELAVVLVLLAAALGVAVGAAAATVRSAADLPDGDARVARLSSPTVGDYVPAVERATATTAALAGALVAVAAAVACAAVGAGPAFVVPSAVAAALAVASLVAAEVGGRRLVARRQDAGDPAELAWQDAFRAWVLRDLQGVAAAVGLVAAAVAFVQTTTATGEDVRHPLAVTTGAALLVVFLVVGTLATATAATGAARHYQRRLWPEVAS